MMGQICLRETRRRRKAARKSKKEPKDSVKKNRGDGEEVEEEEEEGGHGPRQGNILAMMSKCKGKLDYFERTRRAIVSRITGKSVEEFSEEGEREEGVKISRKAERLGEERRGLEEEEEEEEEEEVEGWDVDEDGKGLQIFPGVLTTKSRNEKNKKKKKKTDQKKNEKEEDEGQEDDSNEVLRNRKRKRNEQSQWAPVNEDEIAEGNERNQSQETSFNGGMAESGEGDGARDRRNTVSHSPTLSNPNSVPLLFSQSSSSSSSSSTSSIPKISSVAMILQHLHFYEVERHRHGLTRTLFSYLQRIMEQSGGGGASR
tara:strand:- start:275 stop:1219 length:945 start_codon:yes stop_codon:yes gene_type:complete